MPDASQVSQNIKRSVQDYLGGLTLTWDDADGNPQPAPVLYDATLAQVPKDGAWVDAVWRRRTRTPMASAQRDVGWPIELQCWSRIKDDPMQAELDALADVLLEALGDEQRPKSIPLNDYADPASPVVTPYFIRLSVQWDEPLPSTDLVYGRSIWVNVSYFERF